MVRKRLQAYRDRVRAGLVKAFSEERTPREVAASFAMGVFVTALPTGGLGLGLFFVFVSIWPWISKPALFASVAVFNPFVKPAVYVVSFQVGAFVLGSESAASYEMLSSEFAWVALQQLLVGNVIIAVILSVIGYVVVLHLTRVHRRQSGEHVGMSLLSFVLGPFKR
ncbi:DUF2062 domain-containing protein [Natronorubrum daqingense]|uniref:DUF2062 domain-containing protein n=1 Tax=Natronorubrum daqingense TaxID=588898 RepID=A0A1P8RHK5_9EURY|nr:DUF2062 domain-containing protein [Natronorubrum daqingense]APX98110.1 hypothetical protein BB347_02655 [Natronorubrum daqingense]